MQPLGDKVLIRAEKPASKTKSGILITEEWKTLPPIGTVVAIGPDVTLIKKGDRVLFERYGSIILKEEDMRLCKEAHIFAVIEDVEDE